MDGFIVRAKDDPRSFPFDVLWASICVQRYVGGAVGEVGVSVVAHGEQCNWAAERPKRRQLSFGGVSCS